jgi:hypothetical protein
VDVEVDDRVEVSVDVSVVVRVDVAVDHEVLQLAPFQCSSQTHSVSKPYWVQTPWLEHVPFASAGTEVVVVYGAEHE